MEGLQVLKLIQIWYRGPKGFPEFKKEIQDF